MSKEPREVVIAAYNYLAAVLPPTQKISDVRVEELQPVKGVAEIDKMWWKVVLSYDNLGEFPFDKKREYKEFKVVDEDGKVEYMKPISHAST